MNIRSATITDASRLLEIYSYYVENTAITFEYDVPSLEEFCSRIENTLKKYPYKFELHVIYEIIEDNSQNTYTWQKLIKKYNWTKQVANPVEISDSKIDKEDE